MCKSLFENRFLLYPGLAIHLFLTHWSKSWGSFSTRNCSGKERKNRRWMRMEKWIVMRIRIPSVVITCQSQQRLDEKKIQSDRPTHASTNKQTHVKEVSNRNKNRNRNTWSNVRTQKVSQLWKLSTQENQTDLCGESSKFVCEMSRCRKRGISTERERVT